MSEQHDPFSPQRVDEAVEQLFPSDQPVIRPVHDASERLVQDMQRLYGPERRQYQRAMQRVQDRLLALYAPLDEQPTAPLELGQQLAQPKAHPQGSLTMNNRQQPSSWQEAEYQWTSQATRPYGVASPDGPKPSPKRNPSRFGRRASLLVAVLVILVLVGSMLAILRVNHPDSSIATKNATVTPAATVSPTGTASPVREHLWRLVYSRTTSNLFAGMVWSPDGKRIATLDAMSGVQIWDATTGGHLLKITIPGTFNPRIAPFPIMAWSPDGKWLAIVNNVDTYAPVIVIADARTGALVHQLTEDLQADNGLIFHSPLLSALQPASGGPGSLGITNMVWSPDSRLLALTTSASVATYRRFDILNEQTGALVHRFSIPKDTWYSVAGWSSDGKYLAALSDNMAANPAVVAWDMSTYQLVFQHPTKVQYLSDIMWGDKLVWQPHSHNLAFTYVTVSYPTDGIELWDVEHNQLVKRYAVPNANTLAFSPDGNALVTMLQIRKKLSASSVSVQTGLVTIDVQSGRFVYIYKNLLGSVTVSWSPDGKYLALVPSEMGTILILAPA